jgi:hypothetical protein
VTKAGFSKKIGLANTSLLKVMANRFVVKEYKMKRHYESERKRKFIVLLVNLGKGK